MKIKKVIKGGFAWLATRVAEVIKELGNIVRNLAGRIEFVASKLDRLSMKLTSLECDIDDIEVDIEALAKSVDGVAKTLSEIAYAKTMTPQDVKLEALSKKVAQLAEDVAASVTLARGQRQKDFEHHQHTAAVLDHIKKQLDEVVRPVIGTADEIRNHYKNYDAELRRRFRIWMENAGETSGNVNEDLTKLEPYFHQILDATLLHTRNAPERQAIA